MSSPTGFTPVAVSKRRKNPRHRADVLYVQNGEPAEQTALAFVGQNRYFLPNVRFIATFFWSLCLLPSIGQYRLYGNTATAQGLSRYAAKDSAASPSFVA